MAATEIPPIAGNDCACRRAFPAETPTTGCEKPAERVAQFGPNLIPLFYTALRATPRHLQWENLYPNAPVTINLYVLTDDRELHLLFCTRLPPGTSICPLPDVQVEPGRTCIWRVVFDVPGESVALEGYFWLLERHQQMRWEHGCRVLQEDSDPDFAAIGMALFLADLQLYQEALQCILQGPAQSRRPARALLACTAQALIYQQMHRKLEAMLHADVAGPEALHCFAHWAGQRARYYRERAGQWTTAKPASAGQLHDRQHVLEAHAA
ncbi:MAG: hypothetical protein RMJ43_15480 [Chloroherpetonaceae bacterium]|nr:hypothetical protein [Chthonomonadaceae bacterium]MDW8209236.1 hypothetical protein [Chloroherpetonaceae bacterium]